MLCKILAQIVQIVQILYCTFVQASRAKWIAMSALIAAALALTCLCLHAVQRGTTHDDNHYEDILISF